MKRVSIILLGFTLLLAACSTGTNEFAPIEGATAPDFSLQSLNGEAVTLTHLRGKPVLINFWATWCGPCRLEMPAIDAAAQKHPELVVLAIDLDEPASAVRDFVNELQLSFDPLLDPGGVVNQLYQVRGYPSSYFIDPQGVIQVVHIGLMTESQLADYLVEVGLND